MKYLLVILSVLALSACQISEDVNPQNSDVDFEVELGSLRLRGENDFSMNLFLKDVDAIAVRITSSDEIDWESGNSCIARNDSYECSVNILGTGMQKYLVKVMVEEGLYAVQEIRVPVPEPLEQPRILSPETAPEDNSFVDMSFQEVGAERYMVYVAMCHEYMNDGINPCLNEDQYELVQQDGEWIVTEFYTINGPEVTEGNDVINLTSNFVLTMDESIDYYVEAYKEVLLQDEKGRDVPAFLSSYYSLSLQ